MPSEETGVSHYIRHRIVLIGNFAFIPIWSFASITAASQVGPQDCRGKAKYLQHEALLTIPYFRSVVVSYSPRHLRSSPSVISNFEVDGHHHYPQVRPQVSLTC
jgi:hypothetical protein